MIVLLQLSHVTPVWHSFIADVKCSHTSSADIFKSGASPWPDSTSFLMFCRRKLVGSLSTPPTGMSVCARHDGHGTRWGEGCLRTKAERHLQQKVCWHGRLFGWLRISRQMWHVKCSLILFLTLSAAEAMISWLGNEDVKIKAQI